MRTCDSRRNDLVSCSVDLPWFGIETKRTLVLHQYKLFETPGFCRIISESSLVLLENFQYFFNNQELSITTKTAKIQPILALLIERFKLLINLEKISIDESLFLKEKRLS